MVEKIVDDYYLNIDKTDSSDSWVSVKKKLKFVSKKGEIKEPVIPNEEQVSKDTIQEKEEKTIEPSTPKKEVFVTSKKTPKKSIEFPSNPIETKKVEPTEEKKVFKFRKIEPKKVEPIPQNTEKRSTQFNKVEKTPTEQTTPVKRWEVKETPLFDNKNNFNAPGKKSKDKKFYDGNFFEKKKSTLRRDDFRKNSKFNADGTEKEVVFTRSKISQKKKEEKNIDDISQNLTSRTWEDVIIWEVLTLKELSEKIWIPFSKLIAEFMKNGMMVNINSKIDFDSANIIAEIFWVKLIKDNSSGMNIADIVSWDISNMLAEEDPLNLVKRPPIISIMWHVDHGKTSLLDYIRNTKVAFWEAGWITQSIWAYQVEHNWERITFLDTPGHEAFTVMRARWARSTDIAVLVVAADEWVKPQTVESINHAKEAWIPVIVAINKMDKEWANPDNVKAWLSENWLIPEDWGWDVPMIPVSAKTWFGIDDLLWVILLVAEMQELKSNPNRNAIATVIESHLDLKLWPIATVVINTWTINKWDSIVCKDSFWKVKILKDYTFKWVKCAIPWDPIMIIWLDKVVEWWDIVQVISDIERAKQMANEYTSLMQARKSKALTGIELIMSKIKSGSLKQLKILIKADSNWSLEAIKSSLLKLSTEETSVVIIHSWVWNISESDILMCQWSQAILIWFGVSLLPTAKSVLEWTKIEYLNSKIIYHITEKIEKIITWMLDPKEIETILWKATVWWIFYTSKEFMILWLKIKKDNTIESWAKIRVLRWDKMVWKWEIKSLKLWVEEMKQLEWPVECGIKFVWNTIIEMWDIFELYKIEYK